MAGPAAGLEALVPGSPSRPCCRIWGGPEAGQVGQSPEHVVGRGLPLSSCPWQAPESSGHFSATLGPQPPGHALLSLLLPPGRLCVPPTRAS